MLGPTVTATKPLRVLTSALCPRCKSRDTVRGGYLEKASGSAWLCRACAHPFLLPTLVFKKVP